MQKFPISETIKAFSDVFVKNGYKLYIVGGAVRDYLLNIENSDYDFCTDALPEDVIGMFSAVIPTGIKHGTVTVLFKGNSFEVTTFRTESSYSDKRHPDNVSFVSSLEEDLSRRDFTVNAFAANCCDGNIIDLFNGKEDLDNKIIRAIGNPRERFEEDALRLLRLARFCSKLGFHSDEKTLKEASLLSESIKYVSQERIFVELDKILSSKKPSIGLLMMDQIGLLKYVLPELEECKTIKQNKVASPNVFLHILNAVDACSEKNYPQIVRWALLLHDIGKVKTQVLDNSVIRFTNHDVVGSVMAKDVLTRLKCSNQMINTVEILIKNHMVKYSPTWTDGAVKRFINRVKKENIENLFKLQWSDQIASEGYSKEKEYQVFIQRIKDLENSPLSISDLKINGNDLFEIGIPKDKNMGIILNSLLEKVLDDESLNERETLLDIARNLIKA